MDWKPSTSLVWKDWIVTKICVATIVMEGSSKEVATQEKKLNAIGISFKGIPAGEHNGKRGYQLTFRHCVHQGN